MGKIKELFIEQQRDQIPDDLDDEYNYNQWRFNHATITIKNMEYYEALGKFVHWMMHSLESKVSKEQVTDVDMNKDEFLIKLDNGDLIRVAFLYHKSSYKYDDE